MDVDGIMAKQLEQMEKEKREKEAKLKAQERKVSISSSVLPPLPFVVLSFRLVASCLSLQPCNMQRCNTRTHTHAHTHIHTHTHTYTHTQHTHAHNTHTQIDHWERAKRLVEMPLLEKQYKQQIVEDRQFHEEQEEERVSDRGRKRGKERERASGGVKEKPPYERLSTYI